MKEKLVKKGNNRENWTAAFVPYAAIVAVLIISYFVLFHTGLGSINSAQAQVNLGKVGEVVVDTVTEAATEKQAELNEATGELESPGSTAEEGEGGGEEVPVGQPADSGTAKGEPTDTGPGSAYYMSREGLGGKNITELNEQELATYILQLTEVGGNTEYLELAMPIMERFQVMVSPPEVITEEGVWLSGTRRYSPFDPVGGGPTKVAGPATKPIPPFQPMEELAGKKGPEITAEQAARAIKLVGVMGEEGEYFAILNILGDEKIVRVGDELGPYLEQTYTVLEISLDAVKIANIAYPSDVGIVSFVERDVSGIIEFSISG